MLTLMVFALFSVEGQSFPKKSDFKFLVDIPTTEVKNQSKSATCWSFATLSFIESEILRKKGEAYDLSEMYIVRNAYVAKAQKFVRMHGTINFAGGGEANDVFDVMDERGVVAENVYTGLVDDLETHHHNEMDAILRQFMDSVVKLKQPSEEEWLPGFQSILDSYLGKMPVENDHKVYSLADLGIKSEDYIYLTSFTHHPFYDSFILEVPDNWSWNMYFNVQLTDLRQIVDSALYKGYSVVWAADYSEDGFLFEEGIAVAPVVFYNTGKKHSIPKSDIQKDDLLKRVTSIHQPIDEITVTQEIRQKGFDTHETTDDHLMHIVGKVEGFDGKPYYYVKNSWGERGKYNGYFLVTEAYFDYKTISIMVNKEALINSVKEKIK